MKQHSPQKRYAEKRARLCKIGCQRRQRLPLSALGCDVTSFENVMRRHSRLLLRVCARPWSQLYTLALPRPSPSFTRACFVRVNYALVVFGGRKPGRFYHLMRGATVIKRRTMTFECVVTSISPYFATVRNHTHRMKWITWSR